MTTYLEAAIMEAMNELDHQESHGSLPPPEEPSPPRRPSPTPAPIASKPLLTKPVPPTTKAGAPVRAIDIKPTAANKTVTAKPNQTKMATTKPTKLVTASKPNNKPKTTKKKKAR